MILKLTLIHPNGRSETLGVTPEHPFNVVNEGWVEAGKLSVGAIIHSLDGQPIRVQSVEQEAQRQDTYNFEVADFHTYFVGQNGVWVHNVCGNGAKGLAGIPSRVQSRINLKNSGWDHVVERHFNLSKNASQFTISQKELRSLLQSKDIVGTLVTRTLNSADGIRYVREINIGRNIGLDKFSDMQPTSIMSVLTDKFGNLITATPGIVK